MRKRRNERNERVMVSLFPRSQLALFGGLLSGKQKKKLKTDRDEREEDPVLALSTASSPLQKSTRTASRGSLPRSFAFRTPSALDGPGLGGWLVLFVLF